MVRFIRFELNMLVNCNLFDYFGRMGGGELPSGLHIGLKLAEENRSNVLLAHVWIFSHTNFRTENTSWLLCGISFFNERTESQL